MSSFAALIATLVPANAQQQAAGPKPSGDRAARNWEYLNHDSWGSNYSPQTQINKDNVNLLELKWIYPFPSASIYAGNQPGVGLGEGTIGPPLVLDGVV